MAYIKTNWQDQKVERPHTYEANANPDGSFTLVDSFGNVEQMGTPVNATNMNKIEDGIAGNAIRLHNMNEIFAKDEWVKSGDKLYKSKQDQNKGHAVTEAEWYSEVSLGGGLPVGSIFAHSASASFVPENSVPCDGTEYTQAQFKTLYNDWLVGGRLETCTYEEYQQEVTTNGACAKFGIDTANGKFKVPLIPDGYYIKKGQGTANKAGLPNITGGTGQNAILTHGEQGTNGAISWKNTKLAGNSGSFYGVGTFDFDASRSNPIYGRTSDTVETNAVAYRYFIVVATGSIKQSEMDWSQWASGLEGKANVDGDNFSQRGKEFLSSISMPSTKFVSVNRGASGTQHTAPANGWVHIVGQTINQAPNCYVALLNVTKNISMHCFPSGSNQTLSGFIPVEKGDIFAIFDAQFNATTYSFIYAEGSKGV